jgi:hypothetical protein
MPNKIWVPPLENGIALHLLQCRSKQGIATGPTWQIKKDQTRPTLAMATTWNELVSATKYFFTEQASLPVLAPLHGFLASLKLGSACHNMQE